MKYDILPFIVKRLIDINIKRFLLSRTIDCKMTNRSLFYNIISYILNRFTEKHICSVNQIQFNAIKLIIENMDKIQKRREEKKIGEY